MDNLHRLFQPKLSVPFIIRSSCILISLWYLLWSTSSFLLALIFVLAVLYFTKFLTSKHSLDSSLYIDETIANLTYPQNVLRNFFVIRDYKSFPENLNYSVISRPIYVLLDNIIDMFVLKWHSDITKSKSFPRLVRSELVDVINLAYYRCGLVNKYDTVQYIMDLYLVRLQEVSDQTPHTFTQIQHSAAQSEQAQDEYVRATCDLLMRVLLSKVNYECEALRVVLREILSTQLLNRLFELFSEPSFLYECIVELVETPSDEEEFSSISDDDKEFLRNRHADKKCYEIICDEVDNSEDVTTIQFASLDHSPGERSNKFRIPKVRLFGEGISRFAVYVIEYSDHLWGPKTDEEITIRLVGRRFKEFAALHERLLKDKATKAIAKKINFPSKEPLSSFPFNRLDKEFLTSRRDLFTQYLNEICQHPEVFEGDNIKEFIGHNQEEITVFRSKSSSFIESKIGHNITKFFKSFTRRVSLSDSRNEDDDESLLDMDTEMYASYKDSVRKTKKLTALSRDHAKFLKAPPNSDINDILDKFIKEKIDSGDRGPLVPIPEKYNNPDNLCVSIRDSRFCSTFLHTVQAAFSQSDTIIGIYGLAAALSTALRLPFNRYFINKINLLTSENYVFVYLTKLNHVLFKEEEEEEETSESMTKEEFVSRLRGQMPKLMSLVNHHRALELIADSLADKSVNKTMLFLIVDVLLSMFVPELEHELKPLYR